MTTIVVKKDFLQVKTKQYGYCLFYQFFLNKICSEPVSIGGNPYLSDTTANFKYRLADPAWQAE